MENASSITLSHAVSLQRSVDVIANNIANSSTPGYRAQRVIFEEYLQDPSTELGQFDQVYDYGQFTVTKQGATERTGNTFDVALFGEGYFAVETEAGTQYTRAGNFQIGSDGTLMTPQGYPVLSGGESRITIPPDATNITISDRGDISSDQGIIGTLGVFEFANVQFLAPSGDNLYEDRGAGQTEAENTTVKQGFLETSNVNSVLEIGRLIQTSRDFEVTQRLLQEENERVRQSISRLGQLRSN